MTTAGGAPGPGAPGADRPGPDRPVPDRPVPDRPARPLAVSLDVSAVPDEPVGAGRYTLELARALLDRPDVVLTLWCRRADADRWTALVGGGDRAGGGDGAPPRHPGATVRAAAPAARPARLAWEQVGLPAGLARLRPAVHHGPHYTMPVASPVPTVVTIHDLTFVDHPEWHERSKVVLFRRAIAVARRRAAALVCVSEATARRLDELGGARGPVFVAPHGVDHERFGPGPPPGGADEAERRALGVEGRYLLFLGTVEPRKQVDVLVRAFDRLAPDEPDLTLVVAGRSGWGDDAAGRALAASPHRDRVRRTGYVPESAVPALLRGAAAVCYPAAEEGFGLPALEAAACGAPLVTTAGSVMAELVGPAAVTAPAGSVEGLAAALRQVLAGGPAADERRRAGLGVAARHTWAASAARHVEAYRAAAGGGRRPGR